MASIFVGPAVKCFGLVAGEQADACRHHPEQYQAGCERERSGAATAQSRASIHCSTWCWSPLLIDKMRQKANVHREHYVLLEGHKHFVLGNT